MGLFSSKKKEVVKNELPPLKFPDLPQQSGFPKFPESKGEIHPSEANAIKQAVAPVPRPQQAAMEFPSNGMQEEKPLFVKVEKYKEVMATLDELKERLQNAGEILTELNKIKNKEETEMQSWQADLTALKEKLVSIDKLLFES